MMSYLFGVVLGIFVGRVTAKPHKLSVGDAEVERCKRIVEYYTIVLKHVKAVLIHKDDLESNAAKTIIDETLKVGDL